LRDRKKTTFPEDDDAHRALDSPLTDALQSTLLSNQNPLAPQCSTREKTKPTTMVLGSLLFS
jgi:hypothetical protein